MADGVEVGEGEGPIWGTGCGSEVVESARGLSRALFLPSRLLRCACSLSATFVLSQDEEISHLRRRCRIT